MDPNLIDLATVAVGFLAGGGLVAWRKAASETESISVATMRAVMTELRVEVERKAEEIEVLRDRCEALEKHLEAVAIDPPDYLG